MAIKNKADLTAEIVTLISSQTSPESITPTMVAQLAQDIVDSMADLIDNPFTPPQRDLTKAALATEIGAGTLTDKQWIRITDRNDGFYLYVQSQGTSQISPFGIWAKGAYQLAVIMDYVNGFEGETHPFFGVTDNTGIFTTATPLKIADGSEGAGKVLVSAADGQTSWKAPASYQGGILNPANVNSNSQKMAGLAGTITPSKSGKVLIIITGEMISDSLLDTNTSVRTGNGSAPANGDAAIGTTQIFKALHVSSTTLRVPFCMTVLAVSLTVGTPYWIDMGIGNNGAGNVQLFNTSITAIEQ